MTRVHMIAVLLVVGLFAAACTSASDTPTTTLGTVTTAPAAPPTTDGSATEAPTSDSTTVLAAEDPWKVTVVAVNDYAGVDMKVGIEEMVTADAMIEATVEWVGEPGSGRWCCENPPLEVSDIAVLGGDFPPDSDGKLNGIDYQSLNDTLDVGDRVTMLMRGNTALFVFGDDESLTHPAPQHQADAIAAMRVREARSAGGWDPLDYSPLRAVTDVWGRYHDDWWGSSNQKVALAVSGVDGYPITCSAADLGRSLQSAGYPPSYEGLPSTVAIARDEIVAAATACDYAEVLTLTTFVDGDDTDLFWWSGGSTSEFFIETDRRFGALRQLVLALTNTAYASTEVTAENSAGDQVDQTFYIWPSAAVLIDKTNATTPVSQTLGSEEAERVAILNQMTVEELDDAMQVFPGYALFRTAIDAAGRWRFALLGD